MFLAGIIAYEVTASRLLVARLSERSERVVAALCVAAAPIVYIFQHQSISRDSGALSWGLPVVGILFCVFGALLVHVVGYDGMLRRFFSQRLIRSLGNISYSFYLVHGLALKALSRAMHAQSLGPGTVWHFWLTLPVAFAFAVAVAVCLFCIVERPFSLVRQEAQPRRVPAITAITEKSPAFGRGPIIRVHVPQHQNARELRSASD